MATGILLTKIFWKIQQNWHRRAYPTPQTLSVQATVKGLQALLLAEQGAMLIQALQQTFTRPVPLQALQRLEIGLYQEGRDQRVWRAQATLEDGAQRSFGIIVALAPGASSNLTQRDFCHLRTLHDRQANYCVMPYACGLAPGTGGVAAYTVEWLESFKELVFEVAYNGGVFLVNAHGAHRRFSPQQSRLIWRRLLEILCWYPDLRAFNIQAGDFVGRWNAQEDMALKLTTARQLAPAPDPAEHIQALLAGAITASGYLSDGHYPFDRRMSQGVFVHRMQAVLQRRFGDQAVALAHQQWKLFQAGAFAQQEDWLKEDCILAMYNRWRTEYANTRAWEETCRRWCAYADAVQARRLPSSWWFLATEVPAVLNRLTPIVGI